MALGLCLFIVTLPRGFGLALEARRVGADVGSDRLAVGAEALLRFTRQEQAEVAGAPRAIGALAAAAALAVHHLDGHQVLILPVELGLTEALHVVVLDVLLGGPVGHRFDVLVQRPLLAFLTLPGAVGVQHFKGGLAGQLRVGNAGNEQSAGSVELAVEEASRATWGMSSSLSRP